MDIVKLMQDRSSSRVLFDERRAIPQEHLLRILEGARWAPTAHNMQNFEVLVIDDRATLQRMAKIGTEVSARFVEENYQQLAFTEDELRSKKVGILGAMFPPAWRTHGVAPVPDEEHAHSILGKPIEMCSAVVIVLYDSSKRAPASDGDALGMMSIGCVLQNMWLVAQSHGIGFHVQSVFSSPGVEDALRTMLGFPLPLRVALAVRLGYPRSSPPYLRVRRDLEDFAHHNRYGQPLIARESDRNVHDSRSRSLHRK